MTPAEFAAQRDEFAGFLEGLLGPSGPGGAPGIPQLPAGGATPGQTAPITAQEQSLLDMLGPSEGAGRRDLIARTQGGEFLNSNPFLDEAIRRAQRPTQEALEHTLSRTLPGTFTAAGQTISGGLRSPNATLKPASSAFDLSAARAIEAGARELGGIASDIGFRSFDAERGRQQESITLGANEIQSTVNKLQASALPRLIHEMGVARGLEAWNNSLDAWMEAMKLFGASVQPTIANQQQTSSTPGIAGLIRSLPIAPR